MLDSFYTDRAFLDCRAAAAFGKIRCGRVYPHRFRNIGPNENDAGICRGGVRRIASGQGELGTLARKLIFDFLGCPAIVQ